MNTPEPRGTTSPCQPGRSFDKHGHLVIGLDEPELTWEELTAANGAWLLPLQPPRQRSTNYALRQALGRMVDSRFLRTI